MRTNNTSVNEALSRRTITASTSTPDKKLIGDAFLSIKNSNEVSHSILKSTLNNKDIEETKEHKREFHIKGNGACFFRAHLASTTEDENWLKNKPLSDVYKWVNSEKTTFFDAINDAITAITSRSSDYLVSQSFLNALSESNKKDRFAQSLLSMMMEKDEFMLWRSDILTSFFFDNFQAILPESFIDEFINNIYQSLAERLKSKINQNEEVHIKRLSSNRKGFHYTLVAPTDFFVPRKNDDPLPGTHPSYLFSKYTKSTLFESQEIKKPLEGITKTSKKRNIEYGHKTEYKDGTSFIRSYLGITKNDIHWLNNKKTSDVYEWINENEETFKIAIEKSIPQLLSFEIPYFYQSKNNSIKDAFCSVSFLNDRMAKGEFTLFDLHSIKEFAVENHLNINENKIKNFIYECICNLGDGLGMTKGNDGKHHVNHDFFIIDNNANDGNKSKHEDPNDAYSFIPTGVNITINGAIKGDYFKKHYCENHSAFKIETDDSLAHYKLNNTTGSLYRSWLYLVYGPDADVEFEDNQSLAKALSENITFTQCFSETLSHLLLIDYQIDLKDKEVKALSMHIINAHFSAGNFNLDCILKEIKQEKYNHKKSKKNLLLSRAKIKRTDNLSKRINKQFEINLIKSLGFSLACEDEINSITSQVDYFVEDKDGLYSFVALNNHFSPDGKCEAVSKGKAILAGLALASDFLASTYNFTPNEHHHSESGQKTETVKMHLPSPEKNLPTHSKLIFAQQKHDDISTEIKKDIYSSSKERISKGSVFESANKKEDKKEKQHPPPVKTKSWFMFPEGEAASIPSTSRYHLTPNEHQSNINIEVNLKHLLTTFEHECFQNRNSTQDESARTKRHNNHHMFYFHQMAPVKPKKKPTPLSTDKEKEDLLLIQEALKPENKDNTQLIQKANTAIKELLQSGIRMDVLKAVFSDHDFEDHTHDLLHRYFSETKKIKQKKHAEIFKHCDANALLHLIQLASPEMQMIEMVKTLENEVVRLIRDQSMTEEQKKKFRKDYLDSFRARLSTMTYPEGAARGAQASLSGGPMGAALLFQNIKDVENNKEISSFSVSEIEGLELGASIWQNAMMGLPVTSEISLFLGGTLELIQALESGKKDVCEYLTTGITIAMGARGAAERISETGHEPVDGLNPEIDRENKEAINERDRNENAIKKEADELYKLLYKDGINEATTELIFRKAHDMNKVLSREIREEIEIKAEYTLDIDKGQSGTKIESDNNGKYVIRDEDSTQKKYYLFKIENRHHLFRLRGEDGTARRGLFIENPPDTLKKIPTERMQIEKIDFHSSYDKSMVKVSELKSIVSQYLTSSPENHNDLSQLGKILDAHGFGVGHVISAKMERSFGKEEFKALIVRVGRKSIMIDLNAQAHSPALSENLLLTTIKKWKKKINKNDPTKEVIYDITRIEKQTEEEKIKIRCRRAGEECLKDDPEKRKREEIAEPADNSKHAKIEEKSTSQEDPYEDLTDEQYKTILQLHRQHQGTLAEFKQSLLQKWITTEQDINENTVNLRLDLTKKMLLRERPTSLQEKLEHVQFLLGKTTYDHVFTEEDLDHILNVARSNTQTVTEDFLPESEIYSPGIIFLTPPLHKQIRAFFKKTDCASEEFKYYLLEELKGTHDNININQVREYIYLSRIETLNEKPESYEGKLENFQFLFGKSNFDNLLTEEYLDQKLTHAGSWDPNQIALFLNEEFNEMDDLIEVESSKKDINEPASEDSKVIQILEPIKTTLQSEIEHILNSLPSSQKTKQEKEIQRLVELADDYIESRPGVITEQAFLLSQSIENNGFNIGNGLTIKLLEGNIDNIKKETFHTVATVNFLEGEYVLDASVRKLIPEIDSSVMFMEKYKWLRWIADSTGSSDIQFSNTISSTQTNLETLSWLNEAETEVLNPQPEQKSEADIEEMMNKEEDTEDSISNKKNKKRASNMSKETFEAMIKHLRLYGSGMDAYSKMSEELKGKISLNQYRKHSSKQKIKIKPPISIYAETIDRIAAIHGPNRKGYRSLPEEIKNTYTYRQYNRYCEMRGSNQISFSSEINTALTNHAKKFGRWKIGYDLLSSEIKKSVSYPNYQRFIRLNNIPSVDLRGHPFHLSFEHHLELNDFIDQHNGEPNVDYLSLPSHIKEKITIKQYLDYSNLRHLKKKAGVIQ